MTHVATTPATTSDVEMTAHVHADLAARNLTPAEHLLDAGYLDADLLVSSQALYDVTLCGPVAPDPSWQAQARQGFDAASFAIDWDARTVTCPQGKRNHLWIPGRERNGQEVIRVTFPPRECAVCPARPLCTRAKRGPRKLGLLPHNLHAVMQTARHDQQTAAFKERYARRAGIEGTLSQGVRRCALRQARYRGETRLRLQHVATAVAINLCRLDEWWTGTAREHTRVSSFLCRSGCMTLSQQYPFMWPGPTYYKYTCEDDAHSK